MKYLHKGFDLGAETGDEAASSTAMLTARLHAVEERLREMTAPAAAADLHKEAALIELDLERGADAWGRARPLLDLYIGASEWEKAVEVCDILYRADQDGSLSALGQGVWLAVTFPIDPELSVAMLQHIIDETPDRSDGAAVAAATALYVVDLRADGKQHDDLRFFVMQMLGSVARRHSDIKDQSEFDAWMQRLELADPARFLVRMRNIIDVMVQSDWWFDRESLQSRLPVN